jgi:hypothetical protein
MHPILPWKISLAFSLLLWLTGFGALMYGQLPLARILFIIGVIGTVGHYLLSDSISQSARNLARSKELAERDISRLTKGLAYTHARFWHVARPLLVITSALLMAAAGLHWVQTAKKAAELSRLQGRLYPANEPVPQHPCTDSAKQYDLVVLLGADGVVTDSFPVSLLKVEGKDRLVLDKSQDGSIAVSVDMLKEDGGVLVKITKGEFVIPQGHLHKQRNDRNTLQVTDPSRTQVLIMRFINDQTLLVDAVLRYPGLENPVIFSGSDSASAKIRSMEFQKKGNCYRNSGLRLEPLPQTVLQQE